MDDKIRRAILHRVQNEPFAKALNLEVVELETGYSKVVMQFTKRLENIFGMAHGGAVFSLIDEAFETACNTHGTVAVALNVTVNYVASPQPGATLTAEARELHITRKTGHYEIKVYDETGKLIASCQALAYRKGAPLPFLDKPQS